MSSTAIIDQKHSFKGFSLLLTLLSFSAHATMFAPVTIENQIQSSSAVVFGSYLSSESKKLDDTRIVTEHKFRVEKQTGLKKREENAPEVITVLSPGGEVGGLTQRVEGTPVFDKGYKGILFLKSAAKDFWIQNLSLGTYELKNIGKGQMLINPVFPNHPDIGRISLEKMEALITKVTGEVFSANRLDSPQQQSKIIGPRTKKETKLARKRQVGRRPASIKQNKKEESTGSSYWMLVGILAALGAGFTLLSKSEGLGR